MTGRVLSFAKSAHQSAQELLPWFLTGTLEGEEAAQVEEHLRSCPACRSELEFLRELRSEYVASEPAREPQEALARLRPRLGEGATAHRPSARPGGRTGTRPSIPARVRRALATQFPIPSWVKLALVAQFLLIFGLGWAVLQPDRSGLPYRTLSAAATPEHASGSLVVVFDPSTQQRDVARILRSSGGRVVDGPTASNGYVLAVPEGGLNTALSRLRAEAAVVLAEPLQLERPR
jgi:anti-sigma factor RsiW